MPLVYQFGEILFRINPVGLTVKLFTIIKRSSLYDVHTTIVRNRYLSINRVVFNCVVNP